MMTLLHGEHHPYTGEYDAYQKKKGNHLTFCQVHLLKIIEKMSEKGNFYIGDNLSQKELISNAQLAGYKYALVDVLKKVKEALCSLK